MVAQFEHGPVELYLVGFDGDRPGTGVLESIVSLVDAGTVKLLDLVFVSKSLDSDEVRILELEDVADEWGLTGIELDEIGLTGNDDVDELAADIEPGTSAAVLVVEMVWAKEFASALYNAGGRVLDVERIPAPVVNELIASASVDE